MKNTFEYVQVGHGVSKSNNSFKAGREASRAAMKDITITPSAVIVYSSVVYRLLFMSGYTADVIAHQGVLDDGVAFIQKSFSMADMTMKVREVLDTA